MEIVSYNVTTIWTEGGKQNHQSGFYHNMSNADTFSSYYKITGTVRNIADKTVTQRIDAILYDANGNELFSTKAEYTYYTDNRVGYISDLPSTYTRTFDILVYKNYQGEPFQYFDNVESLKLIISDLWFPGT